MVVGFEEVSKGLLWFYGFAALWFYGFAAWDYCDMFLQVLFWFVCAFCVLIQGTGGYFAYKLDEYAKKLCCGIAMQ